jgi:predicted lactoylglutathione lyase
MKPKKIWANYTVANVERTRKFYTAIGFERKGTFESDALASFKIGENGFVVHFFDRETFVKNTQDSSGDLSGGSEIMFTLSAESIPEVDAWAEEVRRAGVTILSEPVAFGDNYYGFAFADPDGHKWNVFHM